MKKWLMAKSAAAKATLAIVSVLVLALIGVAVYVSVKPAKETAPTTVVSIDDENTPTTDAPDVLDTSENETVSNETVIDIVDVVENEDEVVAKEGYNLVNGNFADGTYGFEIYAFDANSIYYDTNSSGLTVRINDTGTEDWHVQVKQNQIRLEQGRWYRLSLDAKSDLNREITCTMQRNGLVDDNWTPYSPTQTWTLGSNWQTYSVLFRMDYATDNDAVFNVSMGTVNGRRITSNHAISLNNIKLEAMPANFMDTLKSGDNLIANPSFAYGEVAWEGSVVAPGRSSVSFNGGKATFGITNPGSLDWHVQLKQSGIQLEKDQCYRLTFDASSTAARTMKVGIMDTSYVNWYGGGDIELTPDKKTVTVEFKNTIAADTNAILMLSMGKIEGVTTPASTIELENFSLVKIDKLTEGTAGGNPTTVFFDGWELYDHESKHVESSTYSVNDGFIIKINDTGSETWHVQLTNKPLTLESGKTYKLIFEGKSSVRRNITYMAQHNGNLDGIWDTYTVNNRAELTTEWKRFEQSFTMPKTDENVVINFSLGFDISDGLTWNKFIGNHTVNIRNMAVIEVPYNGPTKTANGYIVKNTNDQLTDEWGSKWVVELDPAAYGVSNPVGKNIVATAKMKSADAFKSVLGGCRSIPGVQYDWVSSDLSSGEAKLLIKNYSGGLQVQITDMVGDSVELYDIAVREATEEDLAEVEEEEIPDDDCTGSFKVLATDKEWVQTVIPMTDLLGDVAPEDVAAIKFWCDMKFAVGYKPTDADWVYFLDDSLRKTVYTFDNISFGEYYKVEIGLWNGDGGTEHTIAWKVIKKGEETEEPAKEPNTIVLESEKSGWMEVEIPLDELLGDVKANEVESITFNGNAVFAVGYNKAEGGWAGYPEDADRTTTYTFNNILLGAGYGLKIGIGKPGDVEVKITWTINTKEEPAKEAYTLVISETGWQEPEIPLADLLGDVKAEEVESITFNSDLVFGVGYNDAEGKWVGYAPDADRTTSFTLSNAGLTPEVYGLKIGVYNGGGEHKITWTITKKEADGSDSEDVNKVATITVNSEHKGEYQIIPENYGIENPVGKKIKVTATLKGDGMFKGSIGGNIPGEAPNNWANGPEFESADGSKSVWEYTLDSYVGYMKIDIWWAEAAKIDILDLKVEAVEGETPGKFTPITVTLNPDPNVANQYKGGYDFDPADFVSDYSGKDLNITVTFMASSYFGGAIGANTVDNWKQTDQIDSGAGDEVVWNGTLHGVTGSAKADIWYSGAETIVITNIEVEVVESAPQAVAFALFMVEEPEIALEDTKETSVEEVSDAEEAEELEETEETEEAEETDSDIVDAALTDETDEEETDSEEDAEEQEIVLYIEEQEVTEEPADELA